jgi:8-oxo-dGTP pyrophosphatase MutT (NUDIX family)
MGKFKRTFVEAGDILPEHKELHHRQVYGWINTLDNKIVLVSKDGNKWQFPGGKPDTGESHLETLQREVYEETGINVEKLETKPRFFGYYVVDEVNEDSEEIVNSFLQIRYKIQPQISSNDLTLEPQEIDTEDYIKYADFLTIEEAEDLISWMRDSDELRAFLAS